MRQTRHPLPQELSAVMSHPLVRRHASVAALAAEALEQGSRTHGALGAAGATKVRGRRGSGCLALVSDLVQLQGSHLPVDGTGLESEVGWLHSSMLLESLLLSQ